MLKGLRIVGGFALMLSATGFMIEGGLSRYAQYGIPPHADWRIIGVGLILFAAGGFLLRPGLFLKGR